MKKNILVVAAHPDDEILGCGGALIKHRNDDDDIYIIYLSDGESSREGSSNDKKIENRKLQAIKVCEKLNVKEYFFGNFPDNQLDSISLLTINKFLEKIIFRIKPEKIYTHFYGDMNIDHQIACKSVTTVCRPYVSIFVNEIIFFEIPSSTESNILLEQIFKPNFYIDISKNFEEKLKLLRIYSDEIYESHHPRSFSSIKSLSNYRGSYINRDFAEAFMISYKIYR